MKNLLQFIAASVLLSIAVILAPQALALVDDGLMGTIGSLALLAFYAWILFDVIIRLIHTCAGITKSLKEKPAKKLTHQQAAIVNTYWMIWLFSTLATGAVYTFIVDTSNWKLSIGLAVGGAIAAILAYVNSKQKIMGHTRKELFK